MNKFSKRSIIVIFLTSCICPNVVLAMDSINDKTASKELTMQQSYVWFDGNRERTVWLNPQLVAEFNPSRASKNGLREVYSSAEEISSKHGAIRIWKLNESMSTRKSIGRLNSSFAKSGFSPVLHEGLSGSGRMRALPGNIIVHLDPSWGQVEVDAWLNKNELELVKKLNIGPNILVIKTDSGLVSLETANRLYESGEVVAAYPDWWTEMVTR